MRLPRLPYRLPPSLLATQLAAFALLAACGSDGPPTAPALPEGALEAVVVEPGVSRERLARAVDALFTADGIGETRAVVVLRDGKIVAERYAEGYDAKTPFVGWSISKTVTGVLIGMLVADGRLALDAPAPVPRWQRTGDPRGEITLRHLLQMRSGLRHQEQAKPIQDSAEVRMMYLDGRDNMAGWAEAQPLEQEPGTHFQYSTNSTVILADIAARRLDPEGSPKERQRAMQDFVDARLAVPLGMASLRGEYDASGTLIGGSAFWANARDWAKFGEFLRSGGRANGVQVVPKGWIEFMTAASPAAPDYGAMLWRNADSGSEREVLSLSRMQPGTYGAVGHLGQYVIVSPSQRLVVVRLGKTDETDRHALTQRLGDVFALYPGR